MEMKRRALYNSLRMNWLANPKLPVEEWQVDDYRALDTNVLFQKLHAFGIDLDKRLFQSYAENVDSPEDLTDEFLSEMEVENKVEDEIYLIIFELWRKLITEKKSLSIFLDELDHQIFLYDNRAVKNPEDVQDVLEELSLILDENIDSGIDPSSIFETLSESCANDLESFLYDFILEQIENNNYIYANELLEDFIEYVPETKWFEFLKASLQSLTDVKLANQMVRKLLHENAKDEDLEFNLEILSFIAKAGEHDVFVNVVKKSLLLIETEEDFVDLALLSMEYFDRLDLDARKEAIQKILDNRSKIAPNAKFVQNDQVAEFLKICDKSLK